jgi:hypothetical protein
VTLVLLVAGLVTWMVTLSFVVARIAPLRAKIAELITVVNELDEDLTEAEDQIASLGAALLQRARENDTRVLKVVDQADWSTRLSGRHARTE